MFYRLPGTSAGCVQCVDREKPGISTEGNLIAGRSFLRIMGACQSLPLSNRMCEAAFPSVCSSWSTMAISPRRSGGF
jgi:hypothetical protein